MTPTHPTADQLTRRAFAGVSAYVIAWQGQPVGRVAFREDGGDLRCLLTVTDVVCPSTASIDWLEGANAYKYSAVARQAAQIIRVPSIPDYETDGAHPARVRQAFYAAHYDDWQAALRSAGYDVWQAL